MIGGISMSLSRMCKKCQEREHRDDCNDKRMEALGHIDGASSKVGALVSESNIQPHDYRDINIDVNTIVTIDLVELKKKISESLYKDLKINCNSR